MNFSRNQKPYVAIACGGTGGHLFPGLAVAEQLRARGADVALLISPKEVDQQAVKNEQQRQAAIGPEAAAPFEYLTLPAVGLQNRNYFSFAGSFLRSLFAARRIFRARRPQAVLAMGGFISAPPVLVAKELGIKTFLHESNTIPGRANRYLARMVDEAFVGFAEAAPRLKARKITTTGTPVRPQFSPLSGHARADAAQRLGLDARRPVLLVVGGSQGASGLNAMVLSALPLLAARNWQWLHLTGASDFAKVKAAYTAAGLTAVVRPFLAEMDLALGVAAAAVSRAGASSLAELAALRLPALLVPFPAAADNHQFYNADAYARSGAARRLDQKSAPPKEVAALVLELVENDSVRAQMSAALAAWHAPNAATDIAARILCHVPAGAGAARPGTALAAAPKDLPIA